MTDVVLTFDFVIRCFLGVGGIASHHFVPLVHLDALPLDELEVAKSRDKLVLHAEPDPHAVYSILLDCEWVLLELLNGIWLVEINDYILPTLDLQSQL